MTRPRSLLLPLSLVALLCGPVVDARAQRERTVDIYAPVEGEVEAEHRLDGEGAYEVRFAATGALVGLHRGEGGKGRKDKSGELVIRFPAPEEGAMARGPMKVGGMLEARAKLDAGALIVTLRHGEGRLPMPDAFTGVRAEEKSLRPLIDAIDEAWVGKGNIAGKLRRLARSRRGRDQAKSLMALLAHCYHGQLDKAAEGSRADREALAKLLGVKGLSLDAEKAVRALRFALNGYEVSGRFAPAVKLGTPTRAAVRGEIGRAVLHGTIGGADGGRDDWWRLDVADGVKVYPSEVPDGVRAFVVAGPAKDVLYVRVFAAGQLQVAAPYSLEARNKRGAEHKWVELYERPTEPSGGATVPLPY